MTFVTFSDSLFISPWFSGFQLFIISLKHCVKYEKENIIENTIKNKKKILLILCFVVYSE